MTHYFGEGWGEGEICLFGKCKFNYLSYVSKG